MMIGVKNKQRLGDWQHIRREMRKKRALYAFLVLPILGLIFFYYAPMGGVVIAFKDFRIADGIWNSPWNNFSHFKLLFHDVLFQRAFWNTLKISILRILICFPAPIIFAILLNEIRSRKCQRVVQTVSYVPHFMSWVIVAGFVYQMLSPQVGVVNAVLTKLGFEPIHFLSRADMFVPILLVAMIWQSIGWSAIIYLASMSSISPELYEAADLDGANRFQKALNITVPALIPVITIQLILTIGNIMKGNFDPIFNLYNGMTMQTADVIDTFVFRQGIMGARYDYAAAVGLFQNVIGFSVVLITNKVIKHFNEYGIF